MLANNKTEHPTQPGIDMDNMSNTTMKNEPEMISQPEKNDDKQNEGMKFKDIYQFENNSRWNYYVCTS